MPVQDVFRRLTSPTLKKLYRFVLKRLVGRFLDDDITLEQLDVQLGAGRIELTDISLNVCALEELLPHLSFRLARAHIRKLRVEISYTKLLTESLAFFLDDVCIDIAPSGVDVDGQCRKGVDGTAGSSAHGTRRVSTAVGTKETDKLFDRSDAPRSVVSDENSTTAMAPRNDAGDGLDFVAYWIEQITSKVKVVVNAIDVRILALGNGGGGVGKNISTGHACLRVGCTCLKWCDETPDSAVVTEAPHHNVAAVRNVERLGVSGRHVGGALLAHKRLTVGPIRADWQDETKRKHSVGRTSGIACVLIKHDRRPPLGSTPNDAVLDIDVSLRRADVTLGETACKGLYELSSAYFPQVERFAEPAVEDIPGVKDALVKPLFREDFWYFDKTSSGDGQSRELNFDSLSDLLEQYAAARARLLAERGNDEGRVDGGMSSLEQSDLFFDCVDGSEEGAKGSESAEANLRDTTKVRVRMTGLDATLILSEELHSPRHVRSEVWHESQGASSSNNDPCRIHVRLRRMNQTIRREKTDIQSVAEVGTFMADFHHGSATMLKPTRVMEVIGDTDSSPSVQLTFSSPAVASTTDRSTETDQMNLAVDIQCLPITAVVDKLMVSTVSAFFARMTPKAHSVELPLAAKGSLNGGWLTSVTSQNEASSNSHIKVAVAVPKITVRAPADPSACSSEAYLALVSSVRSGVSPVGWETTDAEEETAPALIVEIEGALVVYAVEPVSAAVSTAECTRARCQMILPFSDSEGQNKNAHHSGLYFLEAMQSADSSNEERLKVGYGLAEDIGKAGKLGVARPADADLKFLHTWEPHDGGDSGLNEAGSSATSSGQRQDHESDIAGGKLPPPRMVLCDLPRLAVELSRLELVVLADVLVGLSAPADSKCCHGEKRAAINLEEAALPASAALEVLVQARGASIVLHEAATFAEDPGPHSYILNLGNACIHLGGASNFGEQPAPMVTVSSADASVHETLRTSSPQASMTRPLLFQAGCNASPTYPSMDDLPRLGFTPVLYQTKWAKGTSLLAAELALSVNGSGGACKTITAMLNLYDVTLRHTVASSWLPRLLGLVVGDVPAGRGPLVSTDDAGVDMHANTMREPEGSLTKMFITVFNGVVDYMPRSQGHGPANAATSGAASTVNVPGKSATEGRAVFPIGVLRVSSNMVAGALMQGFKVVIRDIALYMSNRAMDYLKEDRGLCGGALETRGQLMSLCESGFSSVQEYLETSQFVQIATLNFLDAFLRTRTQVVTPRDAFAAVELWMGVLHVYTCQDSLSTCQALLIEWWDLVNECRAAAVETGPPSAVEPKVRVEPASSEGRQGVASTSLLDDVEQDAFLPGSNVDASRASDADYRKEVVSATSFAANRSIVGSSNKVRPLVIEDYYCVSVKPVEERGTGRSLVSAGSEGEGEQSELGEDAPPDQMSSFLSEQGPAQWLTAPKLGQHHGDNLSMESAEETSESEDDVEQVSSDNVVGALQRKEVGARSTFSFSLPAPIEIELESRHDGGNSVTNEEKLSPEVVAEPISAWSSRSESKSVDTEAVDQPNDCQLQGDDRLSEEGKVTPAGASPRVSSPEANVQAYAEDRMPETAQEGNNLPRGRQRGALALDIDSSFAEEQASASDAPDEVCFPNMVPLYVEQEARWLGGNRESNASGDATSDQPSTGEPEEFRVYPHYIPIPASAEAASLPFLSGDPLLVLGRGLEKNAQGEAEARGSGYIDEKLQFQLAIHDISVCWRLFKGRDWLQRSCSEGDRPARGDVGVSTARNQARRVRRVSPFEQSAEMKRRTDEKRWDHHVASSTTTTAAGPKPRKTELLDALLENYQDAAGGSGGKLTRQRYVRQPRVKLLNRDLRPASSAKHTGRDTSCMLEVVLQNSSLRLDSFHPGPPPTLLSNMLFSIKNLHASDTLTSSRPRKTLQHWRDDIRHPREYQQKMVTIRMTSRSPSDHYCPEDSPLGDELMLKARVLPVRLSFGQHTVDFLRAFAPKTTPAQAKDVEDGSNGFETHVDKEASPFFVSCCDVGPCKVKIDYQPRAIKVQALQHGEYLELLNLFPLEGVQITLKKLLLTGLSGWNGVAQLLLQSWIQDITSNQLHSFLAGTTAVRPLVTVGKGVADLVLLPVEQYRRDGRVLRGLRKGTQSFLRAITVETLHTSHRVASFVARTLDDVVAQPGSRASLRGLEYYDEQPTGVLDSLEHAYDALAKEVQVAAQTVIAIPYEEQEEVMGPHGRSYVRSVARALPVAVLRPVVGASEALSCTLLGFRNYMSPMIRKEEEGRWRK